MSFIVRTLPSINLSIQWITRIDVHKQMGGSRLLLFCHTATASWGQLSVSYFRVYGPSFCRQTTLQMRTLRGAWHHAEPFSSMRLFFIEQAFNAEIVVSHDISDYHNEYSCQGREPNSPHAHEVACSHPCYQVAVVTLDHQHRCAHLSRQQMDVGALG